MNPMDKNANSLREETRPRRTSQPSKCDIPSFEDESGVDWSQIDVLDKPIINDVDQIRQKILQLTKNGGMKIGDFCKAIGVSNNALNHFVHQHEPSKDAESDVFFGATEYFAKWKIADIKPPAANNIRVRTESGAKGRSGKRSASGGIAVDRYRIELPGEATDDVPVYDTCDDVRRKISAYLRKYNVTQAQFCRDLCSQLDGPGKGGSIQASQLQRFRGRSGAIEGCASKVFYAGYIFFERRRLAENKPKSKKRKFMEEIWPNGVDRSHFGRMR